jgi:hypothetical protein
VEPAAVHRSFEAGDSNALSEEGIDGIEGIEVPEGLTLAHFDPLGVL